ncbi:MAG: bifunctional nuclease family protein [Acidobacteria bacterium]|nr:MAG: bifunctional nuclease family protein [Acidobacteriota bacterium]REK01430.1 MAG: bifunctional nuclease family protein [Acidobacteriota bacterium]REK14386.1 MAG: bifunctional nuclease family protein [Acidobacteriota bacterium]REK45101.1 MAG: bifunctional nuclease family protein [Acidobacteriota bacterium]
MQIEVKIGALIMDPNSNTPIVVLKGVDSDRILPIWVGAFEANAIALEIEKIVPQRPMTHDLLRNFIIEIGYTVNKIVISDLKENTFYAVIELSDQNGDTVIFDARPSDAIALALRTDCPIYVEEEVFEVSGQSADSEEPSFESSEPSQTEEWPDLID